MQDRVLEILSNYADLDIRKIDVDMTFEELDLDHDDMMELLIPIEEEYGKENLHELLSGLPVDTKISRFIEMIKENI